MKHKPGNRWLYTASEISLLLSLSRREFFRTNPVRRGMLDRGYGPVPGYSLRDLSPAWRARIKEAQRTLGCKTAGDLLKTKRSAARQPAKPLAEYPFATAVKAVRIRAVMHFYFSLLDFGLPEMDANMLTRSAWKIFSGITCNEKTLYRRARTVKQFGGPSLAPLEAYCDGKSVSHKRNKTSGESL